MNSVPKRCVVDTNVPATANALNEGASPECVASSARALKTVMDNGHAFIDDGGLIVAEYRKNLNVKGQPGPGDAFLRWVLTHEWGGERVTRVALTPKEADSEDFEELPAGDMPYDPSDRKFLAVAAAHNEHPPILQSFDSKWWGWRDSLRKAGVSIHFLCLTEIARKHQEKMG